MKKCLFLLFLILMLSPSGFAESWEDFSGLDKAWDGQKPITDQEFENAMDTLQKKQKEKEAKQRKRKVKKIGGGGTSLHSDLNPMNEINSQSPLEKTEEDLVLNVPVNMLIEEGVPLEKGFYKIIAERDKNNDIYLMFYQSHTFKGKVRACETNDDFDEENMNFVRLIPYDKNFIKVIFGSLDFNAYAYIRYQNEDLD